VIARERLTAAGAVLSHTPEPRSLNGTWQWTKAGDGWDFDSASATTVRVPALWEGEGHIDVDGLMLYRTSFEVASPAAHATLRFGAVMDEATVVLNGTVLGHHTNPFTPFECDVSGLLVEGTNELLVKVLDHVGGTAEHINSAHGKQGWANQEFPSPPSLYMTFGGIWQNVDLRTHGAAVVRDVWFNGDHRDLVSEVDVANVSEDPVSVDLEVSTCGLSRNVTITLAPHSRQTCRVEFGQVDAPRWSPDSPTLQHGTAVLTVKGIRSDSATVRFGLRVVEFTGTRLTIDGIQHRLRSALVQGFYPETLYAEPSRHLIEQEVRQAHDAGFNTLRLHIKAFDPVYLDVCDELGMLLQCDIPVAEPINHRELAFEGAVADQCAAAAIAQVRRDRNHPSVVLWAAMNELGLDSWGVRDTDGYEGFARRLYTAVESADNTRPIIENDWVDADPDRVFLSQILTVHWYGRLDQRYLDTLEDRLQKLSTCNQPFLVNEFGDWGLPELNPREGSPFWWYGKHYEDELGSTPWPGTADEFATATQRYMGMADRLQIELWRRHSFVGGWCLTELTDVPWEFNGVLDFERNLKAVAADHIRQSQQPVLAMLADTSFASHSGADFTAHLWLDNDGPELENVTVGVEFGSTRLNVTVGDMATGSIVNTGTITVAAPNVAGEWPMTLTVRANGAEVGRSVYPVVVHPNVKPLGPVRVIGSSGNESAVTAVGGVLDAHAPVLVVGEGALDAAAASEVQRALDQGHTVVLLAQGPDNAEHFPVKAAIAPLTTEWGGTDFHFTTDTHVLDGFPDRAVLDVHDMRMRPEHIITELEDGTPWAEITVVGLFKPMPRPRNGLIIGSSGVGPGRLITCQYRLTEAVLTGEPAARGVLHDVLAWALLAKRD
jgi:hypothetical protein